MVSACFYYKRVKKKKSQNNVSNAIKRLLYYVYCMRLTKFVFLFLFIYDTSRVCENIRIKK